MLADNKTQAEIEDALEKVCSFLPTSYVKKVCSCGVWGGGVCGAYVNNVYMLPTSYVKKVCLCGGLGWGCVWGLCQ